jgi:aspartyl-tRNA(Asn)/glutamyl-tRNA(Gln) amidotransferase subunit B
VRTEILRAVNDRQVGVGDLVVKPEALAMLIRCIDEGKISTTVAKSVFEGLLEGLPFDDAVKKSGEVEGGVNADALEDLVKATLGANSDVVEEIRSGKDTKGKKAKFLQGLIMRETKGQARPDEVAAAIEAVIKNLK